MNNTSEEKKAVLFRTAFRGYDKQDVNDYITGLVKNAMVDVERYSSHIRSLEEERTENAQKILDLTKRNELLSELVQAEAEARLETEKEIGKYKSRCEKADKELEEVRRQLAEIHQKIESGTAASKALEEKYKKLMDEKNAELERVKEKLSEQDAMIAELKAKPEKQNAQSTKSLKSILPKINF